MMTLVIVIVLALCTVAALFFAVRHRNAGAQASKFDMKAFLALTDREDELFLKEKLTRETFFQLKRRRVRVTLKYVGRIAESASSVLRMSEMARDSQNAEVIETAAAIADLATQVRLQCLIAGAKLCLEFAFPSLQFSPAGLVPKYQSLQENVRRFAWLQPQAALDSI